MKGYTKKWIVEEFRDKKVPTFAAWPCWRRDNLCDLYFPPEPYKVLGGVPFDRLLITPTLTIWIVTRCKDNSTWCIGDQVRLKNAPELIGNISRFTIMDEIMYVELVNMDFKTGYGTSLGLWKLKNLQKLPGKLTLNT